MLCSTLISEMRHCLRSPATYLHSRTLTSWIAVSSEARKLLPRLLQRVEPWALARVVVGEAMAVEVEILLSEMITTVVTGLTQTVVAIPTTVATAMEDRPMNVGQHGDLILDFLQGH